MRCEEQRRSCFFALDLETSSNGRNGLVAEVIQVAICSIRLQGPNAPEITTVYNQWFNPTGSITEEAQRVHGKSKRDLERYPHFALTDAQNIFGLIKGSQGVVCHNYDFDRKILWQQFVRVSAQGLTDYRKWPKFHCTQKMACKIGIKRAKSGLSDVLRNQLGIERPGFHDAEFDARATAQLWLHLRQYAPTQASSGETIIGFSEPTNGKSPPF